MARRRTGTPNYAWLAKRPVRALGSDGMAAVDGGAAGAAAGRPAVTRCPQCGNRLYDPQEVEIAGECAYCGHVEYTALRGEYLGRGGVRGLL